MNRTKLSPLLAILAIGACAPHPASVANPPPPATESNPSASSLSTRLSPEPISTTPEVPQKKSDAEPARLTSTSVPLPGTEGPASLDYVAYEREAVECRDRKLLRVLSEKVDRPLYAASRR